MKVAEPSCCIERSSVFDKSSVVDKSKAAIFSSLFFLPINQNLIQELIYIILFTEASIIIKIRMQYETSIKPLTNHNLPFT
jgi:hypothetical protein